MQQIRPRFYQSIAFQLSAALLALFVLFSAALGYSLLLAEQRERDQVVLGTAARLQLAAGMMRQQALNYLSTPARDYGTYFRDVRLYYQDLDAQIDTFDDALGCFTTGRFESSEGARTNPAIYEYDGSNHPAVLETQRLWKDFRGGLTDALGDTTEEPRLELAAGYIMENVQGLEEAASGLHTDMQQAASERLVASRRLNRVVVFAAIVLMSLTLWWAHRTLKSLRGTVRGFERVARGDFGHPVPVTSHNEVGLMADAFNTMTARLQALFQILNTVSENQSPGETLRGLSDELNKFVSVDWAGLLRIEPDGARLKLEHVYVRDGDANAAGKHFPLARTRPAEALAAGKPLRIPDLALVAGLDEQTSIETMLREQGLCTAMFLPLGTDEHRRGLLVFGSRRPHAYLLEHEQLMSNLAALVGHGFHATT